MKYIDYRNMKEFYTIDEICRLFELDKSELRQYCNRYDIQPQEDQYGNWGLRTMFVRKLHNFIYKAQRNAGVNQNAVPKRRDSNPWA